jgi:hypothetical protein
MGSIPTASSHKCWQVFHSRWASGVIDASAPDRFVGTRLPKVNIPQQ